MGNAAYDERKRLETESRLLRERQDNDRLRKQAMSEAAVETILTGLQSFFDGSAEIEVSPGSQPGYFALSFRRRDNV